MSSEITDPEVLAFIEKTEAAYPPDAVSLSIAGQRKIYDQMTELFRQPRPASIAVEGGGVMRPSGGLIPVRRYWPRDPGTARVLYFHGGGFVVGGLDSHDDVCAEIAQDCGLEVVAIDYRLCPEHPHPAAYEDALAAVDFFADRPLVVVGDSAGGNLAAAVSLARGHKIWGQVLIYPGLGGEDLELAAYEERSEARLLTTEDVHFYKDIRAGKADCFGDPTFAPLQAKSFSGAPACFVSSAEHDPLRDDGPEYVLRLIQADVWAEAVVEPELPHGHLRARHMSARAKAAFDRITDAIRRLSDNG